MRLLRTREKCLDLALLCRYLTKTGHYEFLSEIINKCFLSICQFIIYPLNKYQFIILFPKLCEYDLFFCSRKFFVPDNPVCSPLEPLRGVALFVCLLPRPEQHLHFVADKTYLKDLYKFSQVSSDTQKNVNKSVPRRHSAKNSRERCREVL